MFTDREALIHFVGGAAGGTAGTALTCPLEVVKTRLQSTRGIAHEGSGPSTSGGTPSSRGGGGDGQSSHQNARPSTYKHILANTRLPHNHLSSNPVLGIAHFRSMVTSRQKGNCGSGKGGPSIMQQRGAGRLAIASHLSNIVRTEGFPALYKGLVPNIIGVAPSKAVYFYTYSTSKRFWNDSDILVPNSALVHMMSAASAGFVAATAVNPVWLVKTRLQLHQGAPMAVTAMIRRVYTREGIRGFYRGVTASYAGVSETVIQFVLYEHLRQALLENTPRAVDTDNPADEEARKHTDFINFMVAGGIAKSIACVAAYPHEVVRTRLREESSNARGFFATLFRLYKEGGAKSLYRGLSVQLLRTVPNTAITMGTYELVVYMLHTV